MSYWKALRLLSVQLWRWDKKGYIVAFAFSVYLGATMSLNANELFDGEADEIPTALIGIIDWIFLAAMPIMGSCMNRTIFSIWRDDSHTRRMAVLRAYPIPLPVIIGSRIAQSVLLAAINVTAMLALIYALSPDLRDNVSILRWIAFDAMWICYSLIAGSALIWLELGHSGKRYVMTYLIGFGVVTAIVVAMSWLSIHPFLEVLAWTKLGGSLAIILGLLAVAIAALWIVYRVTIRKIRTRSLAF
ncbi:hypothetical protein [Cohnella panacarvi]|uniref:hypothetical protein n=1 Tax=Cohnella panacarvi TaxID=400776 RepID=UPI00047A9FD7|nr:hypothetical protein [Cohnella panacarvi]